MIPAAILGPIISLLAMYPGFQQVQQTQQVMLGTLTGIDTRLSAQESALKAQGETLSRLDRDVTRILDVLTPKSRYTVTHMSSVFPEVNGEL